MERSRFSPFSSPTQDDAKIRNRFRQSSPIVEDAAEEEEEEVPDDGLPETQETMAEQVSNALAKGGSGRAVARRRPHEAEGTSPWLRLLTGLILVAVAGMTVSYKQYSAQIGFCNAGNKTNAIIEQHLEKRREIKAEAEACHRELVERNVTHNANETCPPGESLFEFLEPLQCTPCPEHAFCTPDTVTCEQLYILRQHPLAEIPLLPSIFNGLPGLGPVAFSPKCIEDQKRKQVLGRLGVVIEAYLAAIRGQRICNRMKGPDDAGEAGAWGLELSHLHDTLKQRMTRVGLFYLLYVFHILTNWFVPAETCHGSREI